MIRSAIATIAALCAAQPVFSQQAYSISLKPGMTLVSGDTWIAGDKRYRLLGVQSCLRGSQFTNAAGRRSDCGDAALALFGAFIKDTRPECAPIAAAPAITYVVCRATVAGRKIDLGTALIARGFAFAALDSGGMPVRPEYAVAEQGARERKAGFWRFPDVQHPGLLIGKSATRGSP